MKRKVVMQRQEIRTPKENLLMFVLVEREGKWYVEVKRQQKRDFVPLDVVLQVLTKHSLGVEISE